ncbi:MAG: hypothetical protein AAB969_03515, partial [Patescibacteria group bacterium]
MMEIKSGNYRIVIIIGHLAIKFPVIHLRSGIKSLIHEIKRGRFLKYYKNDILYWGCSKSYLFDGIICNWQEYRFYRQTKLAILMPTYFSFFGLFNIQKRGQILDIYDGDLFSQLYNLTNGEIFDDGHAFGNHKNFCIESGKLVMIDYCKNTRNVLKKYGEKIQQEFDP